MTTRTDGAIRSDAITDVERPWMDLVQSDGPSSAREALIERGVPVTQANGIAFWLEDQLQRRRHNGRITVQNYRRLLRELDPPSAPPRMRAIRGYRNSPWSKRPSIESVAA